MEGASSSSRVVDARDDVAGGGDEAGVLGRALLDDGAQVRHVRVHRLRRRRRLFVTWISKMTKRNKTNAVIPSGFTPLLCSHLRFRRGVSLTVEVGLG